MNNLARYLRKLMIGRGDVSRLKDTNRVIEALEDSIAKPFNIRGIGVGPGKKLEHQLIDKGVSPSDELGAILSDMGQVSDARLLRSDWVKMRKPNSKREAEQFSGILKSAHENSRKGKEPAEALERYLRRKGLK